MAFSGWRCCQRLVRLGLGLGLDSENKKGPEEAPCAPPEFGWRSAIPGDAPGYDHNKQFGNNITHLPVRLPKGCANHSDRKLKVKRNGQQGLRFDYFSGLPAVSARVNFSQLLSKRVMAGFDPGH